MACQLSQKYITGKYKNMQKCIQTNYKPVAVERHLFIHHKKLQLSKTFWWYHFSQNGWATERPVWFY